MKLATLDGPYYLLILIYLIRHAIYHTNAAYLNNRRTNVLTPEILTLEFQSC
jgi:hypothetical protein